MALIMASAPQAALACLPAAGAGLEAVGWLTPPAMARGSGGYGCNAPDVCVCAGPSAGGDFVYIYSGERAAGSADDVAPMAVRTRSPLDAPG